MLQAVNTHNVYWTRLQVHVHLMQNVPKQCSKQSSCINGTCGCDSGFYSSNLNQTCTLRKVGDSNCERNHDCSDAVGNSQCINGEFGIHFNMYLCRGGSRRGGPWGPVIKLPPPRPPKMRPQHLWKFYKTEVHVPRMAVLGRSQSGPPPDQILDPPLLCFIILWHWSRLEVERYIKILSTFV